MGVLIGVGVYSFATLYLYFISTHLVTRMITLANVKFSGRKGVSVLANVEPYTPNYHHPQYIPYVTSFVKFYHTSDKFDVIIPGDEWFCNRHILKEKLDELLFNWKHIQRQKLPYVIYKGYSFNVIALRSVQNFKLPRFRVVITGHVPDPVELQYIRPDICLRINDLSTLRRAIDYISSLITEVGTTTASLKQHHLEEPTTTNITTVDKSIQTLDAVDDQLLPCDDTMDLWSSIKDFYDCANLFTN